MRGCLPRVFAVLLLLLASGLAGKLFAVTLGQVDDFEDGTTQNWMIGSVIVPPALTVETEPNGNHVLVFNSSGRANGAGGKMTFFNRLPGQWSGDFVSEGLRMVSMDLRNPGSTDLFVRMGFSNLFGQAGTWFITEETFLPAGSDWVRGNFVLESDRMAPVNGAQPFEMVMTSVLSVRIFSSQDPNTFRGDAIEGTLVLDNITLVPEPSAAVLMGLAGLAWLRRRR